MKKTGGFNTTCVHAGTAMQEHTKAANTPIVASTAYRYLDTEMKYPRMFNLVNQNALAQKIAALEKAESGLVFGSGLGAISVVLMGLLQPGDELLIQSNIYGGTYMFLESQLKKIGVSIKMFPTHHEVDILPYITPKTKLIYIETPANPLLDIVDIEQIAWVAKNQKIVSVIDNTFASPYCQTPIELDVDIVIHSGTKYLAGHSDLIFGAIVSSNEIIERLRKTAMAYGSVLDAKAAAEAEKSLKTLGLRMGKQAENAFELAKLLKDHPKVEKVFYPGLSDHPGHDVAKKQMKAFGAMVSFQLNKEIDAIEVQRNLELIMPSVSLGGIESLICSPHLTSHKFVPENERLKMGITNQTLRFSVGIEEVEDLMADLDHAILRA